MDCQVGEVNAVQETTLQETMLFKAISEVVIAICGCLKYYELAIGSMKTQYFAKENNTGFQPELLNQNPVTQ